MSTSTKSFAVEVVLAVLLKMFAMVTPLQLPDSVMLSIKSSTVGE